MKKVTIVTGASSGIGLAAAKLLLKQGYYVVGGARHVEQMKVLTELGGKVHELDVNKESSLKAFVAFVLDSYGRVDVLVNSAGYGSFGALEEVTIEESKHQMDVNLFGLVRLIQLVLPTMRTQKSGRIINISSLAGLMYTQLGGWYHISKHALETMSDILRLEVKPFGVDVVVVEPGNTATGWQKIAVDKLLAATPIHSPYRRVAERLAKTLKDSRATTNDVAPVIVKAAMTRKPKLRYQIRFQEQVTAKLLKLIPDRIQDRLVTRMFS